MIKKIILATIIMYFINFAIQPWLEPDCLGWYCDEIRCPEGYAILTGEGGYLPCKSYNAYWDAREAGKPHQQFYVTGELPKRMPGGSHD